MNLNSTTLSTQDYKHSSIRITFHNEPNRAQFCQDIIKQVKACESCWCIDNLPEATNQAQYFALNFRYLTLIANASEEECEPFKIPTRWDDPSDSAQHTLLSRTQKLNERLVLQVHHVWGQIAEADTAQQANLLLDAQKRLKDWCKCKSSEAESIIRQLEGIYRDGGPQKTPAIAERYAPEGGIFGAALPKTDNSKLEAGQFKIVPDQPFGLVAFSPKYLVLTSLLSTGGQKSKYSGLSYGDFLEGSYEAFNFNSPSALPFVWQDKQVTMVGLFHDNRITTYEIHNQEGETPAWGQLPPCILDDQELNEGVESACFFSHKEQIYLAAASKAVRLYRYTVTETTREWSYLSELLPCKNMRYYALATCVEADTTWLVVGVKRKVILYDLDNSSRSLSSPVTGVTQIKACKVSGNLILMGNKNSLTLLKLENNELNNTPVLTLCWTKFVDYIDFEIRPTAVIIATATELKWVNLQNLETYQEGFTWSLPNITFTRMAATDDAILLTTSQPGQAIRLMYGELPSKAE